MIKINVCLIETEFQLLHSKLLFAFRVRQAKFSHRETAWRSFIQSHHLFFVVFCFVLIQTSQRFGGVFLDWFCGIFFVLFGFISIKGHRSYARSGRSFPQVVTVGTTSRFLNSLQNSAPSQEFSLIWGAEHGWGWISWWEVWNQWRQIFPSGSTHFLCYHWTC